MKFRFLHTVVLLVALVLLPPPSLFIAATADDRPSDPDRLGLDLKLVGTAVADDRGESLAVVETDSRSQIYLREGDVVGSFLVKRILRDQIIVDAGNGEESVKLRQSLSDGTITRPESTQPPTTPQVFGSRPPEDRNFKSVYLDRETAKTVFADIDADLKDVRIDPVDVYGRPTGIRISPITPGSVFAEIGLKTGDVVREVNGKAVFSPEEGVALFKEFKDGGEFDIKVKGRRTRQIHLTVE